MANHKKKKSRKQYNVSAEQFIRVWQTSKTAGEVAERLGMDKPLVLARASTYRRKGVKLKKLQRESKRALDIDALNRVLEKINRGEDVHGEETRGRRGGGRKTA